MSNPVRIALLLGAGCLLGATFAQAHDIPPVPADYPSHKDVGHCNKASLRQELQDYNETRLQLAEVLRHMADAPDTAPSAKARLLSYAESLDDMRRQMPAPDPDSNEFRNFDFKLGMMLTSMTLFLNTEDEQLAERFNRDRDNPGSELGIYLARLERTRERYMSHLSASKSEDCG